jgi:hypothetical protein
MFVVAMVQVAARANNALKNRVRSFRQLTQDAGFPGAAWRQAQA